MVICVSSLLDAYYNWVVGCWVDWRSCVWFGLAWVLEFHSSNTTAIRDDLHSGLLGTLMEGIECEVGNWCFAIRIFGQIMIVHEVFATSNNELNGCCPCNFATKQKVFSELGLFVHTVISRTVQLPHSNIIKNI